MAAIAVVLGLVPLLFAYAVLDLWHADLSIAWHGNNPDALWQLALDKALFDTGWILNAPNLGAPDVARWYANPAPQTSALHSALMLLIRPFVPDAITMQNVYHLLNFPAIAVASFAAARALRIGRWAACCIGLLFCTTPWRWDSIFYAYLGNYFVVPLTILPPIWLLAGRFATPWRALARSRRLWASVAIVTITALADGYFAFFALLMIGFAGGLRVLAFRDLRSFAATALLVLALVSTATAIAWPLRQYAHAHPEQFMVDGAPDPALVKHPFEAEVYASSLKLMIAPNQHHRVPQVARLGRWMYETATKARTFGAQTGAALGALVSLLLFGALALVVARLVRPQAALGPLPGRGPEFAAILALVLFVLLCATMGGIGSLVALVFPTIRAYNRLPLVLVFLLLAGAGLLADRILRAASRPRRWLGRAVTLAIVPLAVLDQTPGDVGRGPPANLARFAAERRFVGQVEAAMPRGAEIYQYPWSNYLTDSPYYGWGTYEHIRFYLVSRHLRWSNGASKNSPVDNWQARLAGLPKAELVTEVRAAGFDGFLVDRTVVGDAEYDRLRRDLVAQTGVQPMLGGDAKLAFWRLPPLGYRVVYGPDYAQATEIVVDDPRAFATGPVSRAIDRAQVEAILRDAPAPSPAAPLVVTRADHPAAFADTRLADAALGLLPIKLPTPLAADVSCPAADRPISATAILPLLVHNRSQVPLRLGAGPAPFHIGFQRLLGPDGATLRLDNGYRVPADVTIPPGGTADLNVNLAGIDLHSAVPPGADTVTAVFGLLQEGVAWLGPGQGDGECRARIRTGTTAAASD